MTPDPQNDALPLRPIPRGGGYREPGYWVWCGSPIRDDDGVYHLFASRWPKTQPFHPGWLTHSEIVRATSERPEGPYRFAEIVLGARDHAYWDGRMTHNPCIQRHGDGFLLFYTGLTYTETGPVQAGSPAMQALVGSQRIGVARAKSLRGPWTRPDRPALDVRPGGWDGFLVSNPAPCVQRDGSVLLAYKARAEFGGLMRYGLARAESADAPFLRVQDGPILQFDATGDHIEDGFLWGEPGAFRFLCKDMKGGLTGEAGAGLLLRSDDAILWRREDAARAYGRTLRWGDGRVSRHGSVERPQLLFEDGRPTHLFLAVSADERHWKETCDTFNLAVPLE